MSTEVIEIVPEGITKEKVKPKVYKLVLLIVFICFSVLLFSAMVSLTYFYIKEAQYYENHFYPHTIINGFDAGHKTAEEVGDLIFAQILDYRLEVLGLDGLVAGIIEAAEIGFHIDIDYDVEKILHHQDNKRWFFEYTEPSQHFINFDITYNNQMLIDLLRTWDIFNPSKMTEPENAFLSEYNEKIKGFEIIPDTRGSKIDFAKSYNLIVDAIDERAIRINLEELGCYIPAGVRVDNPYLVDRKTRLNRFTHTQITYDWNGSEVILDGDLIHQWIIEEDGEFFIDEEQVREFVHHHARENDTYGKTRTFVTTAGVSRRLPGGGFGWRTDRREEIAELMELIPNSVVMEREPIYWLRGYHKGQDNISDSYVEIDLGNQRLYLYIEGVLILESDLVSGNVSKGFTTPEGVFGITYRERNAVLRGATYTTPVRWWMPFNGNIGMHDAGWRRSFGGEIYLTDGSHGCINLPPRVAKEIFEYMRPGFPVVCYY